MKKHKPSKEAKKFDVHRTLPTKEQLEARQAATSHTSGREKKHKLPKEKKRFGWKKAFLSLFLLTVAFIVVIAAWDWLNFSRATQKMFGSSSPINLLLPSSLSGQDRGRVNLLLVGYSADDPGHPGAKLTDSLMLISMSTENNTGYMLSIPRDLYIKMPGHGNGKINEAYQYGGMDLLKQTIEEHFETPVDYYALLNYTAFRDTVNAVNGITVTINSKDPRGLYDGNISPADGGPLRLDNGPQNLDGQTALNLARARGSTGNSYGFPQSDFDRTNHQRLMLVAIKEKATDLQLLLNPLRNRPLFEAVGNNITTDIPLEDVIPLYRLFNKVDGLNMQSVSLNKINNVNLLRSYAAPSGQSALVPAAGINNYENIVEALSQLNNL